MTYKVNINPEAIIDIQEAIDWYNTQQKNLGKKFYTAVLHQIVSLVKIPILRFVMMKCIVFHLKSFPL